MTDTTHTPRPDQDPALTADDPSRPGATASLWILLLLVGAFGWWYVATRDSTPPLGQDLTIIEGTADEIAAGKPVEEATRPATARRAGSGSNDAAVAAKAGSSEPELLSAALPRYPTEERRRGVEGNVTLRIDVDANGLPVDVDYAHRSGNRALDRAALVAARNWRFQPAIRNGEAVASTVTVPVAFRL
ncbi:energy transducer TonB [Luteimonas sp. 8-5]|uniref:energy transducer TonB n=1 Tax=Luteimonas sp. 8-5 TaxID=3039387 RepID=UPI0024363CAD|nr:energy transducer TonB [Luteimonas sp. 8-5]MDG6349364.1 energy transducer TonB [Luteimonas sp. 8-5]